MCPLHFSPGGAYMVLIDVPIIQAATKLCNARLIRIDNNRGGARSVDSKMKVRRNCVNLPIFTFI